MKIGRDFAVQDRATFAILRAGSDGLGATFLNDETRPFWGTSN
jgi:hypothetical protein